MPADPALAQEVFLAAAELTDPAARAAYLEGACDGDAALRARVEALLRAHDQSDSLLDAPLVEGGTEASTAQPRPSPGNGPTRTHVDGPEAPADGDDDRAEALAFLAPPGRPDSLGRLGHYEVLEVLGRGGFGVVFRAFDEVLQRVVAVKVLAPSLAATSPARKRFLREARSSAPIQHENVVRVHEVVEQPLPYLVMEFIPGETLQQTLDRTGPLEFADVLRVGRQVALGLAAAHERGLVHRDIKPGNILVDSGPDRHVKITDFGLARAADDASLTRSGVVAGTPMYMAPEQARGESLDHRADLFSLGSVLYTMLTGRPPFRAETTLAVLKRVAEDTPRPIREVIPEVPQWLCRIVEKLHAKDPAQRYRTAREVADVLADCEQQLKTDGRVKDLSRIPAGRPAARRRRALLWALLPVAALLLALPVGVVVLGVDNVGRYLAGESFVTAEPRDSNVEKIIVRAGDQEVRTFDGTGGSLPLPPGLYDVEVVARAGYRVRVEQSTRGIGASGGAVVGSPHLSGLRVARGDEVRLVIRTEKAAPEDEGNWVQLFNRKDLTGWVPRRAEPGAWKVENGVLVGRGERYGELVTERGTFQDYELRLEARINAGGDSGVFNRVDLNKSGSAYEVQIGCREAPRPHTGAVLLYGEGDPRKNQYDVRARLTKPGEWFTLEITLRDNRIVTRVNGTTTVDYMDPERRCQQGHIILQLLEDTVVEFRKIEIKELPKAGVGQQPFVLLGGEGERAYATLSEAVAGASDSDTIEIRGNGPFVTEAVRIDRRTLTVRAGRGFHAVLALAPAVVTSGTPLLRTNATLVLEGLEFRREALGQAPPKEAWGLIASDGAPFFAAGCRFVVRGGSPQTIHLYKSPWAEVRNCEFLGEDSPIAVYWHCPPSGSLVLENCIQTGHFGVVLHSSEREVQDLHLRLTQNTFIGQCPIGYALLPAEVSKPLQIEASGNLFDGSRYVFEFSGGGFGPKSQRLSPTKAQELLGRLVRWHGGKNVYPTGIKWLRLTPDWFDDRKEVFQVGDLKEWEKLWGAPEPDSLMGGLHYQGGDVAGRAVSAPAKLTAADFRLRADSPGKGRGAGGRDLGTDVDLVGPGAAYERWTKTTAYQNWLKEIGQAKATDPVANPFVLLARGGRPERDFATLVEAVQGAADGDTIEIRGNGPFVTGPIKIKDRALVIRAAAGFRPVVAMSPEGLEGKEPLLTTNAPLTLEGLELHRLGGQPCEQNSPILSVLVTSGPELRLAHCRLLLNRRKEPQFGLHCINTYGSPVCELWNCQVLATGGGALHLGDGRFTLENCIVAGEYGLLLFHAVEGSKHSDVTLRHNTFITRHAIQWNVRGTDGELKKKNKASRVYAADNVLTGNVCFSQEGRGFGGEDYLSADKAQALLPHLVDWREERNLFPGDVDMLQLSGDFKKLPGGRGFRTLEEWQRLWSLKTTSSLLGRARFRGGDVARKAYTTPRQVTPRDFALTAQSPGKGAGEGDRDLGADVDLVGPGAAYERWRKSPEYQPWLKAAGE